MWSVSNVTRKDIMPTNALRVWVRAMQGQRRKGFSKVRQLEEPLIEKKDEKS